MTCTLLKAKIHHLHVTEADLDYLGSLTIASDLMETIDLHAYEKILVANVENGQRFETYAIPGPAGSGVACLNGATAHLGKVGDRLIVMVFCQLTEEEIQTFRPKVIRLNDQNQIVAEAY